MKYKISLFLKFLTSISTRQSLWIPSYFWKTLCSLLFLVKARNSTHSIVIFWTKNLHFPGINIVSSRQKLIIMTWNPEQIWGLSWAESIGHPKTNTDLQLWPTFDSIIQNTNTTNLLFFDKDFEHSYLLRNVVSLF